MLIISFLKSICQSINPSIIHPFGDSFHILHYKFNITNKMKTTMPLIILIIQTLLFTTSCKQTTEPKLEALLKLELEDASCTEAWIRLTTTNLQFPATINLLKNGNVAQTISLWRDADTVLYIDSLLPNQTYRFKSIVQSSNHQIRSNELSVTTMDTTSHEFIWQSWEFGTIGSSTLYDVAIIDENDIWAVGEINIADTSINGYTTYNAVHWDGTKWELKRIYTYSNCSAVDYAPLRSIFAFSSNNIVVTSGGGMWWYDGNGWRAECSINPLLTGAINKLWGSSSEDLYAVGNNGNIAHWDGRKWTKIESGTDIDLNFVSGFNNDLFISGYSLDRSQSLLLRFTNNQVKTIWYNNNINGTDPYGNIIYSSKVMDNKLFISSNRGLYRETVSLSTQTKFLFYIAQRVYQITGDKSNDVYTVGSRSSINHYNGVNKKEIYIDFSSTSALYCTDSKTNIIVAGGTKVENAIYHKAIVVVGKRN